MNTLRTAGATAVGGAALGALGAKNHLAHYKSVADWTKDTIEADRQALFNGQPLADIPKPHVDTDQHPKWANYTALKVGLPILVGIPLVVFLLFAIGMTVGANLAEGIVTGIMFGGLAVIPAAILAFLAGSIAYYLAQKNKADRKVRQAAQHEIARLWGEREEARADLARGIVPVSYLGWLGIDPHTFSA